MLFICRTNCSNSVDKVIQISVIVRERTDIMGSFSGSTSCSMVTKQRMRSACSILPSRIEKAILSLPDYLFDEIYEIRLRNNAPLSLVTAKDILMLTETGSIARILRSGLMEVTQNELQDTYLNACGHTVHAHSEEILGGFLTLQDGHRVGLCGKAVCKDGELIGFCDISSLNIRICREIHGAANSLVDLLSKDLCGLILSGPPGCGKTTILRDLARQLSQGVTGKYLKICIVDERNEIAAMSGGQPQNSVGQFTDVLASIPKSKGIELATRTLSPDVIICDEAGNEREAEAISSAVNSGVICITSMHAGSLQDAKRRLVFQRLISTGAFSKIVQLGGRGADSHIVCISKTDGTDDEDFRNGSNSVCGKHDRVDACRSIAKTLHTVTGTIVGG